VRYRSVPAGTASCHVGQSDNAVDLLRDALPSIAACGFRMAIKGLSLS
jgi:hypothetical protein